VREVTGPAALEKVEAVLRNPAVFALADLIPEASTEAGGRPRSYPNFMVFVYGALCSVWRSARQWKPSSRIHSFGLSCASS